MNANNLLEAPSFRVGRQQFTVSLKQRIRSSQVKAAVSVNRELVLLYWQIGNEILTRQEREGWGAKVIDRLSLDLIIEFPDMKGFSVRNLKYMRKFAAAWRDSQFVQQVAAQIPWFHHCVILDKVPDLPEREWYICETIRNGWSRNVLVHQIESGLVNRAGTSVTNFSITLPAPQSDLAREVIKDPYIFDFLGCSAEKSERELHQSLLEKLRDFLVELGIGFAFIGSEYHLEIGDQDFYLDLLFYHTRLHCYIIIELKIGAFVPEFAGKLNFYLSAADDMLRDPAMDKPCIGILLCREKNRVIAEYALRDMSKPMAISTYHLGPTLPPQFQEQLPDTARLIDIILKTTLDDGD
ncbi:MAG: PDDEXK nuclease domain-containing protein [Methanoregula sp.]|nr:PDDEXK nuclease domain-containing protein [Methanoregula sp.]